MEIFYLPRELLHMKDIQVENVVIYTKWFNVLFVLKKKLTFFVLMVFASIHWYLITSNILYKSIKYIIKCTHTYKWSVVKKGLWEENDWAKTWRKWVTEPGGYMG